MIDYIVLPEGIMSHEEVTVPNEKEPIILNFVIVKGVHNMHQCVGRFSDTCLVYDGFPKKLCQPFDVVSLGIAKIYEVKHMVLSDLHRYSKLLKYFHDQRYCRTYFELRARLAEIYDGIIDCEIVTLVMFTPGEGLLDGTTATPETKQGPKQI